MQNLTVKILECIYLIKIMRSKLKGDDVLRFYVRIEACKSESHLQCLSTKSALADQK